MLSSYALPLVTSISGINMADSSLALMCNSCVRRAQESLKSMQAC